MAADGLLGGFSGQVLSAARNLCRRFRGQIWRFSQKLRFSHFSFGLIFKKISSQKKASLASTVPKPSMR